MPSLKLSDVRASNAAWKPAYAPVAVFVGGTSGIGKAVAEAFARTTKGNAHIVLIGRNRTAAESILSKLPPPPQESPTLAREFLPCDLSRIPNVHLTTAALLKRFPQGINFLFLTAGAMSFSGLDLNEDGIDKQLALQYYSRWAFIADLIPALRAAQAAGQDARVSAIHSAGRGGLIDLNDLGLVNTLTDLRLKTMGKLISQLASYQDLMVESFGERNHSISFAHTFPGLVDTPLMKVSSSKIMRMLYPVRYLLFPPLWWAMSAEECGERQLYGLLNAPAGASRITSDGTDMGLNGQGDTTWAEAREKLWAHTEKVVGKGVSS
ncbi:hypothetical protein R3P38DRAFT_2579555 [Favolaschia claudopus]|uniref:NAD(P)-binding protein n=1 Tax=Favolaschia claudopus TaxID=2862362 RepID=A0AAV9ZE06_9AGAR